MALTEVQVVNMALLKLGADTITALTDTTKPAQVANALYDTVRDVVLSSHPWPCCVKRAMLDMDTVPEYGWANAFDLPSDFLALVDVEGIGPGGAQAFEIEDGHFLTDLDEVNVRYIYRNEDPGDWEPLLVECVVLKLASEMAYPIVGKESVANTLMQVYEMKLNKARTRLARTAHEPTGDDYLVNERP